MSHLTFRDTMMINQKYRFWGIENPHAIHEEQLHSFKVNIGRAFYAILLCTVNMVSGTEQ